MTISSLDMGLISAVGFEYTDCRADCHQRNMLTPAAFQLKRCWGTASTMQNDAKNRHQLEALELAAHSMPCIHKEQLPKCFIWWTALVCYNSWINLLETVVNTVAFFMLAFFSNLPPMHSHQHSNFFAVVASIGALVQTGYCYVLSRVYWQGS